MSNEYTPPPGRPQASPPDQTPPPAPFSPSERGLLGRMSFQAKLEADPAYARQVRENMGEGQRAAYEKANRVLERECRKLNLTETRGVWFTHISLQRHSGWDRKRCDNHSYRHRIEMASHKRVQRFLLPYDKVPEGKTKPAAAKTRPALAPVLLGDEVRIRRINISRAQIEEHLTQLRGLTNPTFAWDAAGNVVITAEE